VDRYGSVRRSPDLTSLSNNTGTQLHLPETHARLSIPPAARGARKDPIRTWGPPPIASVALLYVPCVEFFEVGWRFFGIVSGGRLSSLRESGQSFESQDKFALDAVAQLQRLFPPPAVEAESSRQRVVQPPADRLFLNWQRCIRREETDASFHLGRSSLRPVRRMVRR